MTPRSSCREAASKRSYRPASAMADRSVERERARETGGITAEAPAPLTGRASRASPFPDGPAKHLLLSSLIWLIDIALLLIWCANIVNILATVAVRTIRPIYVSVWFFIASPLWLAADYAIGNVIWKPGNVWGTPSGALSGSLSDAMLNWWYAHNLFGLWLTPMLLALTYYIVPRVTNTPLYSYTLSLISFWGMAFFYTGVGDHHILQSPTPAWLKTIAEVSSWMLLVPVFAFTTNILGTLQGNWDRFFTNLPLRFTMTAFFFYFLVNLQGAFEALQPFNKLTHFTNFVVAHAHLALLGAFTI